jgi:hypothetical protein
MIWFNYALIRYTPNVKRGETINVGLVVFKETGIDVRVLASTAKVRMIDGASSQADIDKLKESMQRLTQKVSSPDEQYQLLSSFNSGLFLSNKAQFALDELRQYDDKVTKLFSDLVKPFASKEAVIHAARLTTELKNKFSALNLLAKDTSELSQHKVVHNYLLSEKTGLYADFLLKNGIYHLSEVVDFNFNDTQAKFKETSLKAMTFDAGKKALSEPVNCYFVYSASAQKESEITHHLNLVEDYCDKMFNMDSRDDRYNYLTMITELAQCHIPIFH